MGQVYGGQVVRASQVMHGKTSLIRHDGTGVFAGLPQPLVATRYHSLVVDRESFPAELEITAESDDGSIMGLRHRSSTSRACSSTPSRSSRSAAMTCSAPGSTASTRAWPNGNRVG